MILPIQKYIFHEILLVYFLTGHAFEARIYAENVPKGFLPATGILHHYCPVQVSSAGNIMQQWTTYFSKKLPEFVFWIFSCLLVTFSCVGLQI